jgi:hypothetical protein
MGISKTVVATVCMLGLLVSGQVAAQAPQQNAQANAQANATLSAPLAANASYSAESSGFFDNYSLRLGFESSGPLLFRDVPDARAEQTTVFQIGPRFEVLFGHELRDVHRGGLGFSYLPTGRSDSRHLTFIPLYLLYETGHPLVLQASFGANVASGSSTFQPRNYAGVYTGLALRYSFLSADKWSPVTVSPGIVTHAIVSTRDMQYSSVFLGAQIEIMYNSNN